MATIEVRQSADGTLSYRAKIRLQGHPTEYATFKRKTDAKKWAHSIEVAIREGRHFKSAEAKRHTFAELVERSLKEVLPDRPRNAVNTLRHLGFWKQKLGAMALSDITPALLVQYRNELLTEPSRRNKPRSNATVVRYLASISHAFTVAMKDWQWVTDNPVSKISKPRQARGRERYLSDDERERLLAACRASSHRYLLPVVVLAISTGMRRGEIMNLRWSDVDCKPFKPSQHENLLFLGGPCRRFNCCCTTPSAMEGRLPNKPLGCHAQNLALRTGGHAAQLSDHGDDSGVAHALPGRAQQQGVKLGAFELPMGIYQSRPKKRALVQSARRQPDADAVVHQHLDAVGSLVGYRRF